ncbi:Myosin-3 [Folsomia candida]|uniref:Myosin-3 n=1 Tax=Folsomia candida TaxID=158441 RepID=A0A226DUR0_FOLCA|nr:Myosin-3 [Folsomia candida]
MNRAVTRISMKLSATRSLSGFNPPNPNDAVQKQINELKKDIDELEAKIAGMDPTSDLDKLRAAVAVMQTKMAALNTALDNAAKQATDTLQPEIDQLTSSLDAVAVKLFSLKLAIAEVESALEESQIVDIVSGIISGPDAGTVFHYEHGVFKRGNASTVMSTIVTLGYPEILKDTKYFLNFLSFFSQLSDDQHKFWGYKALYYAVLANGQLYNAAQPFILGHKIAKIYDTSPTINVTLEAGHFLSAVVHPVISSVVSQRPPPRRVQWGLHLKQLGCVDGALEPIEAAQGLKFSFPYDFEGMDMRSIKMGCAFATAPNTLLNDICFLLLRGNTLKTKIDEPFEPLAPIGKGLVARMEGKCDFHDCALSIPPDVDAQGYQIFNGRMFCLSSNINVNSN